MSRRKREAELTFEEMQNISTTLYDCSITLKIEIPRVENIDVDLVHKVTLTTIAHEFTRKHEDYDYLLETIYLILKKTLSTSKTHWKVFKENGRLLKKNRKNSGHILDVSVPEVTFDEIKFSGQVTESFAYGGSVNVECSVQLFLSPGVHAGKGVYQEHKFPVSISNIKKKREDFDDIMETYCLEVEEHEKEGWDFGHYWGWLSVGFVDHQECQQIRRNRSSSIPREYEFHPDDEDDDHHDEEESEEAKAFFEELRRLSGRRGRRRGEECCLL